MYYTNYIDTIRRFVYIYHIAIFFWCAGFFFKERSIKQLLSSVFKKQYLKTTIVCLLSFILLPLWRALGVINPVPIKTIIMDIIYTLLYRPSGILTGALWFMTLYTISLLIYWAISKMFKKQLIKYVTIILVGIAGLLLVYKELLNFYYFNLALCVQPVILLGVLYKQYDIVDKTINKYCYLIAALSFGIIILINYLSKMQIELTKHEMYNNIWFYPMILLGLLFCISFAHVIEKYRFKKVFTYIGMFSFAIMAGHFQAFKVLDVIYRMFSNADISIYPIAFPNFFNRVGYIFIGIGLPLLVGFCCKSIWGKIKVKIFSTAN